MFSYAYFTRNGEKVHCVSYQHKAVEIHDTESDARNAAADYNTIDKMPKGIPARREWLERWQNAPDLSAID